MLFEIALRLTTLVAVVYIALLLLVYFSQTRLLYLPDQYRPSPERVAGHNMQHWPESGSYYRGLLASPVNQAKGTIIVFHGNAGSAWDRRFYVKPLIESGYRVILAEYPGYAGRSGPLGEQALVTDAGETIEAARQQFGDPVILWGESLGAAVAAAATVGSSVTVNAVVLITPWDSLPALAQTLYWYLPARWLTRDQYNNSLNLKHYAGRVAVLIAEQDEIIPAKQSAKFYGSLTTTKQLWVFSGANHNSWPIDPKASWWKEVTSYITSESSNPNAQAHPPTDSELSK